jgi:hypothetical protein
MTLSSSQSLKLIATNRIKIDSDINIEGNFNAKIVDCPGPQMQMVNTANRSDNTLRVIPNFSSDSTKIKDPQEAKNRPILSSKIFPNPSDGKITIELEGKLENQAIKIELINSAGQIVFSKDNITEMVLDINISHLPKGIYFLKGTFGNKSVSDRIILE